jgi:hypothetical protein
MTEFGIESMVRHDKGFFIAEIIDYRTQDRISLHNRWGSWWIGDPFSKSGRAPETISKDLPFVLQDRLAIIKKELDKITSNPFATPNPFLAQNTGWGTVDNPFMSGASS